MRIDRDEAMRRLQSPKNLANQLGAFTAPVVTYREKSKTHGPNVPAATRDAISRAALAGEKQATIAARFGVDQRTVSTYKTNHIGGLPPTADRRAEHEERVHDIKDTALTKLMGALGLIDEAKLENLEAKDLGKFAKDMAAVHRSLSEGGNAGGPTVNLVIYSPKLRTEEDMKSIDI